MNCEAIQDVLKLSCQTLSGGTASLQSPFSMPGDGATIGCYIIDQGDGILVTDDCEVMMNLASRGLDVSRTQMKAFGRAASGMARLDESGEILCKTSKDNLKPAVADVLALSLIVAHRGAELLNAARNSRFDQAVGAFLESRAAGRVKRHVRISGASGRQIELPFVVEGRKKLYIQTVPFGERQIPQANVFRGLGKMTELSLLDIPIDQRVIVLDDGDDPTVGQAMTLLSTVATVLPFSARDRWADKVLRAA